MPNWKCLLDETKAVEKGREMTMWIVTNAGCEWNEIHGVYSSLERALSGWNELREKMLAEAREMLGGIRSEHYVHEMARLSCTDPDTIEHSIHGTPTITMWEVDKSRAAK